MNSEQRTHENPNNSELRILKSERRSVRTVLRSAFAGFPVVAACSFLSVLVVLGASCARQRQKEPMVNGMFLKQIYPTDTLEIGDYDRWIEITDDDAMPQIPKVILNGCELPMVGWNPIDAVYDDAGEFKTDTTYSMEIEHYWGKATSRVYMPADFRMTWPDSSYVYNRDSLLTVRWGPSRGATWYWLNLFLDYDYLDTLYEWDYYEFDRDTILYDTICTYERNRFFPWYVRQILAGEAEAVIWACDGPVMAPGAMGNVWGDGFGYLNTANQPREAYFVVVQPPASRRDPRELLERSKEKLMRRMREFRSTK